MVSGNKLHWAGRPEESLAVVVPKTLCREAGFEYGMSYYTNFAAGVACTPSGRVVRGPGYEPLCGDNTLHALREAVMCEALDRRIRIQLQKLLVELDKFRSPWDTD